MKYRLVNPPITHDYGKELFRARGIEDVEKFIDPDKSCLQDWRGLGAEVARGVSIIADTIQRPGAYALIEDSDCDGVSSGSIIYLYLKRLNPEKEIQTFIHSGKQHGVEDQMEELLAREWDAIIIPDAGTNDGKLIEKFNCPVLILDHHIREPDSVIPSNMILINNQVAQDYKNKELSGAGVTWQFCRALDEAFGHDWAYDYIDLCGLSIVSDMMGMLSYENQYLVREGLSRIQNKMFRTLIEKQDFSMGGKVTPTTVAFYIVPLINAMIRVGTQDEKRRLYDSFIDPDRMVECHKRGAKGTQELLRIESSRECVNAKALQDRTKEKMTDILDARIHKKGLLDNQILFVRLEDEDDFPATLNGLCAMSLCSKYKKPTIIARLNSDGYDRGSARAPGNTELDSFKDYLAQTGLFEYTAG